jgi:hypothetical protein
LGDHLLVERTACSALVITCSDFRFKSAERALVEAAGLRDDYDLIARPGSSRPLAEPSDRTAGMLREIRLLHDLHAFSRALLVHHISCAAYADLTAGHDERAIHREHLRAAAAALEREFGDLSVEPYLVDLVEGALQATAVARDG